MGRIQIEKKTGRHTLGQKKKASKGMEKCLKLLYSNQET